MRANARDGRRTGGFEVALLGGLLLLGVGACRTPPRSYFDVPAPPTPLGARATASRKPVTLPGGLSLKQAVELARARNPDVGSAEASIQAALAGLTGARAQRRPVVSLDASIVGGNAPSVYLVKRIDARLLAPGTDFNYPGNFYNLEAGATLRYRVWDGGRRKLGEYAAEAGVHVARSRREIVMNDLSAMVVTTFLATKAAEELLRADEASVRTVESQVAQTRAKVEQGGALRSDLLSLEVRL
ncbi:MAG: TolC family protein, partial [Planctomycetota bacterium]